MFPEWISPDSLSLYSNRIEIFSQEDEMLATWTAFFYEYKNIIYLVTNAHNLTRTNPETGERITRNSAIPHRFKMKICVKSKKWEKDAFWRIEVNIDLYKDSEQKVPDWFMHPKFWYNVDVICTALFNINEIPDNWLIRPINKHTEFDDQYPLETSDDVFVLWFPFNIAWWHDLPIWKKWSLATEPSVDIDGLPKMLIDTATREWMSWSPVIFKRSGIHWWKKDSTSVNNSQASIWTITWFIGIYSARIGKKNEFEAQLGIVWKKTVIDEILSWQVHWDLAFQQI